MGTQWCKLNIQCWGSMIIIHLEVVSEKTNYFFFLVFVWKEKKVNLFFILIQLPSRLAMFYLLAPCLKVLLSATLRSNTVTEVPLPVHLVTTPPLLDTTLTRKRPVSSYLLELRKSFLPATVPWLVSWIRKTRFKYFGLWWNAIHPSMRIMIFN